MRIRSEYGVHIHRKKTIHRAAVLAAVLLLAAVGLLYTAGRRSRSGNERKELLEYWNAGAFDQAFSVSGAALASRPLDYFLLTLHGFSAYQLGIAQINSSDTLGFIDECVRTLRKAMLLKSGRNDGRVFYVLGKAYCYKGPSYADLAVLYLEKARAAPYQAGDIPEYLGLAYANLRDYRSSVAAFSQALEPAYPAGDGGPELSGEANPSDVLLLSIARSYTALEETESAQAYLLRCIEVSRDVNTRVAARLLLGEILGRGGTPVKRKSSIRLFWRKRGKTPRPGISWGCYTPPPGTKPGPGRNGAGRYGLIQLMRKHGPVLRMYGTVYNNEKARRTAGIRDVEELCLEVIRRILVLIWEPATPLFIYAARA